MDVYEAILNKRDTRDFSEEPVSDEDLHKVLQAGAWPAVPRTSS
ncbi:MAG TPA: hypothetical protein VM388_03730 [Acidimicrobiales bacterium]|nr:hypothetical protein [Acidimicrobiales bacterium]HWI04472.1 hypothetical protein [Acidimicrobiales bacterium]